jgi:Xaa-Pro aminopeptidase
VKSPLEIEYLRKAAELTSDAVVHVMKNIKPGWTEREVDSEFTYYGMKRGASEKSFLTIAASGQNSVYLHSSANEGTCNDGDMLLIDCGFFWNHYAGDVTRTFPVNGKFSDDQKLVYNLLLKEQLKLIDLVQKGKTFITLNDAMFRAVFGIAKELKIIKEDAEYSRDVALIFVPHSLTHHVGCNVHDVNFNSSRIIKDSPENARTLVPGMVITIEPGIYFHKTRYLRMKEEGKYADIIDWDLALRYADSVAGIRIEDDVLVTEDGHEVISTCPKTVEEIEKIMAK